MHTEEHGKPQSEAPHGCARPACGKPCKGKYCSRSCVSKALHEDGRARAFGVNGYKSPRYLDAMHVRRLRAGLEVSR